MLESSSASALQALRDCVVSILTAYSVLLHITILKRNVVVGVKQSFLLLKRVLDLRFVLFCWAIIFFGTDTDVSELGRKQTRWKQPLPDAPMWTCC